MTLQPSAIPAALFAALLAVAPAWAQPPQQPAHQPFIIAPTIEGMYLCDEATKNARITDIHAAESFCRSHKRNGAAAVMRLLDTLEPGGPKGRTQVGFTLTLQLLGLYQKAPNGSWHIDANRIDAALQLVRDIKRPVVIYLAADHFDTVGPLSKTLAQDPQNLMQLRDGTVPQLGYFGYPILPYTLSTDPTIPVNKYRFEALELVAKRIASLPTAVQRRIVAINLLGELHQMFPDFENGMGMAVTMRTTDYSPQSVAGFRQWLQAKYQTTDELHQRTGLRYGSFGDVPAPSKDIRTETLQSFGEHYDTYAAGTLPLGGWLWDPDNAIQRLELYVDGKPSDTIGRYLNRLDVYRALAEVTSPNTGYRIDYDYTGLRPGRHIAQVIAHSQQGRSLLAEREFVVVPRDQSRTSSRTPTGLKNLNSTEKILPGIRTYMDMPKPLQDVYYNPLARDWNAYRAAQVYAFLDGFYERAVKAGLPADKLYSHQIVPNVNSSWNHQLFAVDTTLQGNTRWKQGLNMYGGATNSPWMNSFIAQRKITGYGVPEFNPQQWKREGVHLAAMQTHMNAGARFIAPYYFSVVPQRFKANVEQDVNRMELAPDNPKDGSDKFYRAIIELAKQ
ncbi:hypothetical protein G7045_01430 [Acidovorax sp. HDW3]|uniref:hypothetical protein n=1 Tax=Acidovorax sp. HDW3 TaxID=2714923 RepID=UPI00140BAADD|nr:hypothetical protein [Acidovorax sp. HDW3]QIL43027.1 hypothetical protein G7045_01430 [Acidovorax sp. HDW3]